MKAPDLAPWPDGPATPPATGRDDARARVLAAYDADGLQADPELLRIVRFAARLCEAPTAFVTIDQAGQQRVLAHEGRDERAMLGELPFSLHAIEAGGLMEVADARQDARFAEYALVTGHPGIRFCAGHALLAEDESPFGSLCVIDTLPRPEGLSDLQREGLAALSHAIMQGLKARRADRIARAELERSEAQLKALADSIPAIAWSADAEGNFDYFNKRLLDFTGRKENRQGEAFHPDDWDRASAAWRHSLQTGEPYEVEHRLRRSDGEYRWMMSRTVPVRDAEGVIRRWFGTAVDIHELHAMAEARDLLARELSHRIKNIFAVVSGLVALSVRKHPECRDFADEMTGRIRSLGRAHDFVRPDVKEPRDNLGALLMELFAPYGMGEEARVRVAGFDLPVNARAATPLALVFHELATNAVKYGSLSAEEGRVELEIHDADDMVRFVWREMGGPPLLNVDEAHGFGTRLVDMSITGQLGGRWERRWHREGLEVELEASKLILAG